MGICRNPGRSNPYDHVLTVVCPAAGTARCWSPTRCSTRPRPDPVRHWLAEHGWHDQPEIGLVWGEHTRDPDPTTSPQVRLKNIGYSAKCTTATCDRHP